MDDTTSQPAGNTRGISLIGLIALVISSSIGSGVFALSTDISAAAAPGPALIAWLITGIGFMALATTFGRLSVVRPDLNGIVDYAREGFGPFVGLVSGWGYWLSIWIGNVAFGVMLVTAIGYFFPPFSSGLTAAGVAFISMLNWAIVLLVNRGVEEASALNAIVMVCKLVPIFAFILAMVVMFDPAVFTADFWGNLANNLSDPALAASYMAKAWLAQERRQGGLGGPAHPRRLPHLRHMLRRVPHRRHRRLGRGAAHDVLHRLHPGHRLLHMSPGYATTHTTR